MVDDCLLDATLKSRNERSKGTLAMAAWLAAIAAGCGPSLAGGYYAAGSDGAGDEGVADGGGSDAGQDLVLAHEASDGALAGADADVAAVKPDAADSLVLVVDAADIADEVVDADASAANTGDPCVADGDSCAGGKASCQDGHCMYTDAKGYKWTLVPAGTFWMGCNAKADSGCSGTEKPQHLVNLSAYWIGVYEVTVSNYAACVDGGGGCTLPGGGGGATWGAAGKAQNPLNYVTWAQSQAYCQWLGGDLPTEAQWEKAARGGCEVHAGKDCAAAEPKFPWGNADPACGEQAVFKTSTGVCATDYVTYAVGAGSPLGASAYGAYDMAGNVYEWNLDYWDAGFYGTAEATAQDAVNSISASERVIRGGGLFSDSPYIRAGYREFDDPETAVNFTGMRCARLYP